MHSINAQRSRVACTPIARARPFVRRAVSAHCSSSVHPHVQQSAATSAVEQAPSDKQAVLYTKFKAHDAAVTALAVLKDEPGFKQVVTASLDKSLAVWTLEGGDLSGPQLQCSRMEVSGGPVFSLQRGIKTKVTDVNVKPREPVLFCGLAAKEITALRPDTLTFSQQMRMNGHTGWVRSLASTGKYLFSCGCNNLHQWDQAYAVPKEVRSMSLFTGDILALAATDKAVFTAGADGSLRRWALGKLGELSEAEVRDKAHDGRITALAVSGSLLFSAGYDGAIKAWDVSSLNLVMEVKAAHAGERVRSLVMGPTPPSSKAVTPSSSASSSPSGSPGPSPPPSPQPVATASMGETCIEAQQPAAELRCFEAQEPHQPQHQQDQQPQQQQAVQVEAEQQPAAAPEHVAAVDSSSEYEPVPDTSAVAVVDPMSEYEPVPDTSAVAVVDPMSEYEPVPDTSAVAADPASEYEPVPDPPTAAVNPASEYEPVPDPPVVEGSPEAATESALPAPAADAEANAAAAAAAEAVAPEPAVPEGPTHAPAVAGAAAPAPSSPSSSRPSSPSSAAVLYSAGDDGLVRRWDARLLTPVGEPLTVHHSAVKALAIGEKELLVSGDASGEVAVWLL